MRAGVPTPLIERARFNEQPRDRGLADFGLQFGQGEERQRHCPTSHARVLEDFADQVVSEYKLIKVKGQQNPNPNPNPMPNPNPQPQKVVAPAGKLAVSQALKDLENN